MEDHQCDATQSDAVTRHNMSINVLSTNQLCLSIHAFLFLLSKWISNLFPFIGWTYQSDLDGHTKDNMYDDKVILILGWTIINPPECRGTLQFLASWSSQ